MEAYTVGGSGADAPIPPGQLGIDMVTDPYTEARRRMHAEQQALTEAPRRSLADPPPARNPTPALTRRERLALEAIRAAIDRRGYPPTVREIGDAIGLSSSNSVVYVLEKLVSKGWIVRDRFVTRGIRVLDRDGRS